MTSVSLRRRYIKKLARTHLFGNMFCSLCASCAVLFAAVGLLSLLDAQYGFFSSFANGFENGVLLFVFVLIYVFAIFPLFCGYKRFLYFSFTENVQDFSALFYFFRKKDFIFSLKFCTVLILKSFVFYFPPILCFSLKEQVLNYAKTQHTLGNIGDFSAHFIPALYVIFSFFLVFLAISLNSRYALAIYIFVIDEKKDVKDIFTLSCKSLKGASAEIFAFYFSFLPIALICLFCIGAFLLPFAFSYFNIAKTAYLCYFHAVGCEMCKEKIS